jgi:carbamoyl-phosphate synthase large subunit
VATKLTVLVLGVGGNVSQGILKALALSNLNVRVIGACISPLSLGLFTTDRAFVSPAANAPEFPEWLLQVCEAEGVQAILSGVEPVVAVLSQHAAQIRERTGAICIVSDPTCLAISDDKLTTCRWLEQHGFNFPRYADGDDAEATRQLVETPGYPLIAKPRRGKGAHGIFILRDEHDLAYVQRRGGAVIQEYLGDDTTEYTVGCFCDRDGALRGTLVLHREILEGTTYRAQAGEFPVVRAEAERIARVLRPMGPCNIQMRITRGRAVCFEINGRFSGTTPVRARLGFNEVEASLRHFVLGEPAVDLPHITEGVMLRYWNEAYPDAAAIEALERLGRLDAPGEYGFVVEDFGVRS